MNFVCFVPDAGINGLATDVKTGASPPALQREDEAGETRIEVAEEVEHRGTLAPSTAPAARHVS